MKRPLLVTALFFGSTLAWCLVLVLDSGTGTRGRLFAADALVLAAVAVVGILVAQGRWARRLAIGVTVALPIIGTGLETSPWWWAALLLSGVALAGLLGPTLNQIVRRLPSATGPPAKAVLLVLTLLAAPAVIALLGPVDGLGWTAAALCVVVAGWYAKAAPGALTLVRTVPIVALIGAGLGTYAGAGLIIIVPFAIYVGYLAWSADARLAVHPLIEEGRRVPMLPEMVPGEILDAAGLDPRGRPKESN
ncbi:MAG: hypothetical protein OEY62_08965 [Acidimicrobiia bacterium]|nr:hypothetical protein [Acidimicrobiia bacterium]